MENFFKNNKRYIMWPAFILLIGFLFLNISYSYFNILDSCYIKIKRPGLANNQSNIKKAIRFLKKSNRQSYDTFCRYTDTIIESDCMGSDWHLDAEVRGYKTPGCYIKGSKTMYLNPILTKSFSQNELSEILKSNSAMSEKFWSEKEK